MKNLFFLVVCVLSVIVLSQAQTNPKAVVTSTVTAASAQTVTPIGADDLCTAINKLLKFGSTDAFESIKEPKQKYIPGLITEYYWPSTYLVKDFLEASIRQTITNKNYYRTVYFRDKDPQKALEKYNELIKNIKNCFTVANCTFRDEINSDTEDLKRFDFWNIKAKPGASEKLEKYFMTVNYIVETDSKEIVIFLNVSPKE